MSDSNYDITYLKKYVNGQLSAQEMYTIERAAQRDPMLADLLMGMEMDQNQTAVSELNDRIIQRVAQPQEAKVKVFDWKRLTIAAAVVAVLGVGILYFQQQRPPAETKRTADATAPEEKNRTAIQPQDSASVSPDTETYQNEQEDSRLANNSKPAPIQQQHSNEEASSHSEPLLRIKPLEKMDRGIRPDRSALDATTLDSVVAMGYASKAKKMASEPNVMIRGYGIPLASRAAGINLSASAPLQVTVRDKETGLPISGVTIMQPNSKLVTNTDIQGKATIQPSTVDSLVDIMALGYNTVALNMRRSKNLNIKLQPSSATLDEVVITTMSSRKTKNAEPVWGWKSFNNYVKKKTSNSRYEGTVRLSFYIDKDGYPTNINVLQSTNDYVDAKAKEIVLSGPKWKVEDNRYVTLTLEFTF